MNRTEKAELATNMGAVFAKANLVVVTRYSGLTVEEITDLRRRMRAAFSNAGPEAVHGFRKVLEQMIDPELRGRVLGLLETPRP